MKRTFYLSVIVTLLLLGCGRKHVNQNNSYQDIIIDKNRPKTVGYVFPKRAIDFFGVKLIGSFPTILNTLDSLPFFDIDTSFEYGYRGEQSTSYRYYATVLIDSIYFGMNVYYPKEGDPEVVKSIMFINSDSADYIRSTIVSHLIQYYGSPEIDEGDAESTYAWPSHYGLRFRRSHNLDYSTWTFYFSL